MLVSGRNRSSAMRVAGFKLKHYTYLTCQYRFKHVLTQSAQTRKECVAYPLTTLSNSRSPLNGWRSFRTDAVLSHSVEDDPTIETPPDGLPNPLPLWPPSSFYVRSAESKVLSQGQKDRIRLRDQTCLLCSSPDKQAQVAHIMSRTSQIDHEVLWLRTMLSQPDFIKRDPQNLMLLCSTHHDLYDRGCFTVIPTENNLLHMIGFEHVDFQRRERAIQEDSVVLGRRVPPLEDMEPAVEILWMYGPAAPLQFGDHNLHISGSTDIPQSVSWIPIPATPENGVTASRKLELRPSPYGDQAVLDLSYSHPDFPEHANHRLSPYALLARSFSAISQAICPANDRIAHMLELLLYLRRLYNRRPTPMGVLGDLKSTLHPISHPPTPESGLTSASSTSVEDDPTHLTPTEQFLDSAQTSQCSHLSSSANVPKDVQAQALPVLAKSRAPVETQETPSKPLDAASSEPQSIEKQSTTPTG